jgi:hypothetical protein
VEEMAFNFDWLMIVLSVMYSGEIDKFGKLEINRLMRGLEPLKIDITKQELLNFVKQLGYWEQIFVLFKKLV